MINNILVAEKLKIAHFFAFRQQLVREYANWESANKCRIVDLNRERLQPEDAKQTLPKLLGLCSLPAIGDRLGLRRSEALQLKQPCRGVLSLL